MCHILRYASFASKQYDEKPFNAQVALGDHGIQLTAIGRVSIGILLKALIVAKISLNLISGSRLEKAGYTLHAYHCECDIINFKGEIIFTAKSVDNLYVFNLKDLLAASYSLNHKAAAYVTRAKLVSFILTRLDVELLHKRFGHASVDDIITGLRSLHASAKPVNLL
jgi:hypothetical protein